MSKVHFTIDKRGVATLTLNNPDKHNVFDDQLIGHLTELLEQANQDDKVRVLVLAATGKSFSAGADLAWMQRMANYDYQQNLQDSRALAKLFYTLNFMSKPSIARVQGAAFGGAVGLVSCCDMAVASTNVSFCLSEVKIGLIPATISPYVIAAIGERACRRYFTTAERFSAERAYQLGLISEVVESPQLDQTIERLISSVLLNSPQAITAAKQLVFDVATTDINPALIESTCEAIANIRVSAEGQEGLNAFLQKRPPAWITREGN
ncbi:enoyl-CoA hydratase/isomerase family protein [Paraferrimonas sp. SM1919]|uniref:enoyl-CoA hydratase/isomerase family protein n=1 Tax=Paraferrimonas sp. SM1919 TaxID=2662263 RepID=UPI0013D33599|nr:enoyl-CoA hydratase/isomerase family protein [Paraferrimonas sp. SM1919]